MIPYNRLNNLPDNHKIILNNIIELYSNPEICKIFTINRNNIDYNCILTILLDDRNNHVVLISIGCSPICYDGNQKNYPTYISSGKPSIDYTIYNKIDETYDPTFLYLLYECSTVDKLLERIIISKHKNKLCDWD